MAVTDWKNPGTAANDSSVGTIAWSNLSNILSENSSYADALPPGAGIYTYSANYLKATNFGFSIPDGATIDGIEVRVVRKQGVSVSDVSDNEIKIIKGGAISSTNLSSYAAWATTDETVDFGGTTNLWGETWSASDINNSNFGVVISPELSAGYEGTASAYVDNIQMRVYYTESEGPVVGNKYPFPPVSFR